MINNFILGDEVVPVGLYMQGKGYITWYDEIGITWKGKEMLTTRKI